MFDFAAAYPAHNAEHLERRAEWFKGFFGYYPWEFPAGFEMPGGVWSDPKAMVEAGHNYVIYGHVGSGKSTAVAKICWNLILSMNSVKIRGGSVSDIVHRLKSRDVEDYRKSYEGGDVLVFGDLDKMAFTRYEAIELLSLADDFFKRGKSVLVDMNPSPLDFAMQLKSSKYDVPEVWADSFLSRLNNKADVVWVKNTPDFRKSSSLRII